MSGTGRNYDTRSSRTFRRNQPHRGNSESPRRPHRSSHLTNQPNPPLGTAQNEQSTSRIAFGERPVNQTANGQPSEFHVEEARAELPMEEQVIPQNSGQQTFRSLEERCTYGYDFPFEPTPDHRFMCPICLEVLKNAVQTKCGHRFCKFCLESTEKVRRVLKCPVDMTYLQMRNLRDVFPDPATDREVKCLTTKCVNNELGCTWRGELLSLENHLKKCMETMVVCEFGCGSSLKKTDIKKHKQKCINRLQECDHCKEAVRFKEIPKHQLLTCPKFPVECDQCGMGGIVRHDYAKHIDVNDGNCLATFVPCIYAPIGCSFWDRRGNIQKHYKRAAKHHSNLTTRMLVKHSRSSLPLSSKVCQCLKNTPELGNFCTGFRRLYHQDMSKMFALTSKLQNLETLSHGGNFLWKVKDVGGNFPRTINSPPFFIGSSGYELHLNLTFPANDSKEQITASLQFKVKKDSDNFLLHPVRGSFKVALLHRSEIDLHNFKESHRPADSSSSFSTSQTFSSCRVSSRAHKSSDFFKSSNRKLSTKRNFKVRTDFRNLLPNVEQKKDWKQDRVTVLLLSRKQMIEDGFKSSDYIFVYARVSLID